MPWVAFACHKVIIQMSAVITVDSDVSPILLGLEALGVARHMRDLVLVF